MGKAQKQAFRTERFRQKQELFRGCTALDGVIKNQIYTAMQPVFLFPMVDQLTGFEQVNTLQMLQNIFKSYKAIDKINLKKNSVKMKGPHEPTEPLY